MSIVIGEREKQRRLSGNSASREYIITGTESDLSAHAAMLGYAPTVMPTTTGKLLPRNLPQCQVDEIAQGIFLGRMSYGGSGGATETEDSDDAKASFDIGGLSIHRSTSIATVNSYGDSPVPDFHGCINVREDGEVGGVDLPAQGSMVFSETWHKAVADVTQTYIRNLMSLYLCVNSSTFRNFAAGECLFLGASGQLLPTGDLWAIDYRFGISINETGLAVGGITGIDKKGWDYLWTYFEPDEDDAAKYVVRRPRAVYVEQVHEKKSFAPLGI